MTTELHPPDSWFAGLDCPVQTLKTVVHEENTKKPGPVRIAEWLSRNTKLFQYLKDEPWQKNTSVAAGASSTCPPASLTIVDDLHMDLNNTPTIPKKRIKKFLPVSPNKTAYAVSLALQRNAQIAECQDLTDRLQEKEQEVVKLTGTVSSMEEKIAELEAKLSKTEAASKTVISTPPADGKLRQELTAALAQTKMPFSLEYRELMQAQLNDKESSLRSSASELDQVKKQLSDTQRVAEIEIQDIRHQANNALSEKTKCETQVKSLLRKIDSDRDFQQQRDLVDYLHISAHCKRLLDAAAGFEQQSDASKYAVTVIEEHVEALANITERNRHSIPLDFRKLNNIVKLREGDGEKTDGEELYSTELHEPSAKRKRS
ncbi:uncharacterized protein ARMOST_11215 [Armillaria ostoyae]|uniref:Uncharacterized protein n=1 Tax=Armillaria ostoyae TaxID=47428 RepID=A0A284RGH9_ARMOS|nr:uncharacterized protein ARMOST_11215 [Armillaria ostoyae]